jgi:hypothetical protein
MPESMTIAVAGATGRAGSRIVELLNVGGHDVVPMSPSTGMAVVTGGGLARALAGVECVIDVASRASPDQQAAGEFFTAWARTARDRPASGCAAASGLLTSIPNLSSADSWWDSPAPSDVGSAQGPTQLRPPGDVQLAIDVAEMGLDRLAGDEQDLGDLWVAAPLDGELGDAPLRRG